jgi:menaquinone-specific isochorismate synthase
VTGPRVRTVAIDDPGDLLARLPDDGPVAWVRRGDGLIGWGRAAAFPPPVGAGRFDRANDEFLAWCDAAVVDDAVGLPGTGPIAFASLTFDPQVGGSVLVVPRVVVGRRAGTTWMTTIDADDAVCPPAQPLPPPTRVRYAGASVSELHWLEAVAGAAQAVRDRLLEKVVLARDLKVWSADAIDGRTLARRLAERFDDCWTFLCEGLMGATPELLVRRTGDEVTSIVLAGSAARGSSAADDDARARALGASSKDRVEHAVAVASVVDRLAEVAADVRADADPWLLRLANVQHLATTVTARLDKDESALQLAGLLHPTAAVCGTPTDVALTHIRAAEGLDRGRYAGPVGWMDARGNGELGIALRCAEIAGARGRLFAGAGIVAESLPEAELEETRLKLRAMQSALEGSAP